MKWILSLIFCLTTQYIDCQDLHFSQFYRCPLQLNPANTGGFDGDIRGSAIVRNQWASIVVPYNSIGLSGDMNIPIADNQDKIGVGIQMIADRAGDSKYTTIQASLSGAYHFVISGVNPAIISLGAVANFYQRSYDPNQLTMDNQFNGDYFDPTIPINEQFDRTKLTFVDFGLGLNIIKKYGENNSIVVGSSIQHIPSIQQNFLLKSNNTLLQMKWNFYFNGDLTLNKYVGIMPMFFYQNQDKKQELVSGIGIHIHLAPRAAEKLELKIGTNYRINDAFIPWAQFEQKNISYHLSYDWNTSPLRIASNSYGGLELSVGITAKYRATQAKVYNYCPYIWF